MKHIRKIVALMLAILVLVSSTSFVVGMHFCMGEVKSVTLSATVDKCAKEEQKLPLCHKHNKSDCCQDKLVSHDGDDFQNTAPALESGNANPVIAILPSVILSDIIPTGSISETFLRSYDPPLPLADLILELRVFRI